MNNNWNMDQEELKKKIKQFGKKGTWIGLGIIGAIVIAVLIKGGMYTVREQEQAVITTFGIPKAVTQPGLHFKIPLIQEVQLVDTTIQGFPIGYRMDGEDSYQEPQYDENGELVTEQYTPVIYNGIMIPNVNSDVGKSQITKVSGNDISNPPRKGSNAKLKEVKYIRDCVDGNTVDNNGYWLEIQAIKDGKNLAAQEGVTVSGTGGTLEEGSVIIDGVMDDTSSVASISGGGQKCVQVQLTSAEDLDEIAVWHQYGKSNMSFKGHTLSVSTDGSNWRVVRDKSTDTNSAGVVNEVESASGIRYNTFHGDSLGEIPEGNYYIFSANSDNMVLSSYTENDNTFARMSDFTGKSNQIWRVYKSNGVYRIVNTSSNMALEVSEDSGEAGVLIDLYTNNVNDTSQNWNIASLKNGYYTITSSNGLRMGYNTSSTAAETQTSTQEKEQRWKFVWADY